MPAIVCKGIIDECWNLYESYGEICVGCNACGRFNEATKYESRLIVYSRNLLQLSKDLLDERFQTPIQQENIKHDMARLIEKLRCTIQAIGR